MLLIVLIVTAYRIFFTSKPLGGYSTNSLHIAGQAFTGKAGQAAREIAIGNGQVGDNHRVVGKDDVGKDDE